MIFLRVTALVATERIAAFYIEFPLPVGAVLLIIATFQGFVVRVCFLRVKSRRFLQFLKLLTVLDVVVA